jgi:hypothetical protein
MRSFAMPPFADDVSCTEYTGSKSVSAGHRMMTLHSVSGAARLSYKGVPQSLVSWDEVGISVTDLAGDLGKVYYLYIFNGKAEEEEPKPAEAVGGRLAFAFAVAADLINKKWDTEKRVTKWSTAVVAALRKPVLSATEELNQWIAASCADSAETIGKFMDGVCGSKRPWEDCDTRQFLNVLKSVCSNKRPCQ